MLEKFDIQAFILAGGKSSRMGNDKGLSQLHGQPLIGEVVKAARPLTASIEFIANNNAYKQLGIKVHKDVIPEMGPMGGLFTALGLANTKQVLILSCDIPFVNTKTLELLISAYSISMPYAMVVESNGRLHPLIGIYSKELLPIIAEHIEYNKLKMLEFLNTINAETIKIDKPIETFNINTPKDLDHARHFKKGSE